MQQVLRELTQNDFLLKQSKVEIGGRLGHNDHEMIKFKSPVNGEKCQQNLNSERGESWLQAAQGINRVPWENIFGSAGVRQCWSL